MYSAPNVIAGGRRSALKVMATRVSRGALFDIINGAVIDILKNQKNAAKITPKNPATNVVKNMMDTYDAVRTFRLALRKSKPRSLNRPLLMLFCACPRKIRF